MIELQRTPRKHCNNLRQITRAAHLQKDGIKLFPPYAILITDIFIRDNPFH